MTVFDILPDFSSKSSVIWYFSAVVVQMFIFLIALVVMDRFVFSSVKKSLELRKKVIAETEEKTNEVQSKNRILKEEFSWRMEGASQLAAEKKEIAKLISKCRADMLLLDVRRETNRDLENVIKSTEFAYKAVAPTVEKDVEEYAQSIAQKILSA